MIDSLVKYVSIPLINNLEIKNVFKNKDREEGVGVIDFINRIIQQVRRDLGELLVSIQNAGLIKLVNL